MEGEDVPENLLRKIYLFRDMTSDQLSYLKEASTTSVYNAADEVFSQGDKATSLYVMNYGSIKVYQTTESGEKVNVATLGTGSHFGEMSFLDNEPRSASVEIIEKSELMSIDYEKLRHAFSEHPAMSALFHRAMSIFMCSRLRQTTKDLNFARELNLTKHL